MAKKSNVVDLAPRRAARKRRRVHCLTVFLDEEPEQIGLLFRYAGRSVQVRSVHDAARKWIAFRDATGAGASELGNGGEVVDGQGTAVARISYNGRVWKPEQS